jgi:signal transduction histidine kinase
MLECVESRTRLLLTWSLGGLVLLGAALGIAALAIFDRIHADETALRVRFAERSALLERIRNGIYLSGSLAQDNFAVPNAPVAAQLNALRDDTARALRQYGEATGLSGEVTTYWRLLDLMADVAARPRTPALDAYFRRQLSLRRETMLRIAGEIGAAQERESRQADAELEAASRRFHRLVAAGLALVVALGAAVALGTARRLLRVEREAQSLGAQLVKAQEQERRAVARELHDDIGQALANLLIDVGGAARLESTQEIRPRLAAAAAQAERLVDAVRRMALALRPSMLDDLGLVAALEWQAREIGRRTGLTIEVDAADGAGELADPHRTCIYRVVQEALQNCVRHAGARHVRIGLERAAKTVSLRVADDGKGFQSARSRGLGLLGMEERVAQLGGRLRVESQPGRGTTVRAELPV